MLFPEYRKTKWEDIAQFVPGDFSHRFVFFDVKIGVQNLVHRYYGQAVQSKVLSHNMLQ